MDFECSILRVRLLRKHWPPVGHCENTEGVDSDVRGVGVPLIETIDTLLSHSGWLHRIATRYIPVNPRSYVESIIAVPPTVEDQAGTAPKIDTVSFISILVDDFRTSLEWDSS